MYRTPGALAVEAASETVAACAKQGDHETAQVVDADGVVIATMRGEAGRPHARERFYKAYTAASSKNEMLALAERAKGEDLIPPLVSCRMRRSSRRCRSSSVMNHRGDRRRGSSRGKLDHACARAGLDKIKNRRQ